MCGDHLSYRCGPSWVTGLTPTLTVFVLWFAEGLRNCH